MQTAEHHAVSGAGGGNDPHSRCNDGMLGGTAAQTSLQGRPRRSSTWCVRSLRIGVVKIDGVQHLRGVVIAMLDAAVANLGLSG